MNNDKVLTVSCSHIDTCLSCYLTDHHQRPGEHLIGVCVDGNCTYEDVMDELIGEVRCYGPEDENITDEMLHEAIRDCFSTVLDMSELFDARLDKPEDVDDCCDGDYAQAWFLFEWNVNGSESEA